MKEKHRTQFLCYEILSGLKQLKTQSKHADVTDELWQAMADRVIDLEGHGAHVFAEELKAFEKLLARVQRRHHWFKDKRDGTRIAAYKAYCQLLSQAYDKFDEPTTIARKANHMAEKHSDFNVGVAQSYELWKLRNQIRKGPSND